MATYRAKRGGCVEINGIDVVFEKGQNVTPFVEVVTPAALRFLTSNMGPWEDVEKAIKAEQAQAQALLDKISEAKAKAPKKGGKK